MHALIIFCAKYMFLAVVLGWLLAVWKLAKPARLQLVLSTCLAGAIAFALSLLAAHLHYEARPFVTQHVQPLLPHGADNGFPSDHALLTMTLTAVVVWFDRRIAACMLVATVLVGWGRVAARLHSPQQILAAWVLAVVAALIAHYAVRYFRQSPPPPSA